MTPAQHERVKAIRARYPWVIILPGQVIMAEEPVEHPGLAHCASCMADEEAGYPTVYIGCCCVGAMLRNEIMPSKTVIDSPMKEQPVGTTD